MTSSGGDFDALGAYLSHNTDLQASGHNSMGGVAKTLTDAKDEEQMQVARLMNDLKNIRQTQ